MNKPSCLFGVSLLLVLVSTVVIAEPITQIAFGSCLRQNRSQPIWDSIISRNPDMFVFMGDNIYADTTNPQVMQNKYKQLANQPGFKKLKNTIPIFATWDDHDYGQNDAGEENPIKEQAEQIFLDFFDIPTTSPARRRPGVYDAHVFGHPGQSVQLILLDTRYFRGPAIKGKPTPNCPKINYMQQRDPDISLLGEAQWEWLATQLRQPARIRIIVSSIQVIPDEHCREKWSNFPLERQKLFDVIASTNANGIVFISGDRHLAEISKLELEKIGYPLYEITSSGMNTKMRGEGVQNRFRIGADNYREHNFGMISIDWDNPTPKLALQINNKFGEVLFQKEILLSELNSKKIAH